MQPYGTFERNTTESIVRPWVKRYQKSIKEQKKLNPTTQAATLKIGKPRGIPLYLEEELDTKVRSMLVSLRVAGAGTNIHVVRGALNGFGQNQSNTESILSSK